jgi:uncharacterized protein (DUF1330 family)
MSTYVIVELEVHDPQRYEDYKRMAETSIATYGGRYVVRGGAVETLEGDWHPKRIVVLEFESMARVRQWWDSPEYREGKALRRATATSRLIAVEGL